VAVEKVFLIDMKIIKSFEDAAFLALPRVSNGTNPINHTWLWGLGDDGKFIINVRSFHCLMNGIIYTITQLYPTASH